MQLFITGSLQAVRCHGYWSSVSRKNIGPRRCRPRSKFAFTRRNGRSYGSGSARAARRDRGEGYFVQVRFDFDDLRLDFTAFPDSDRAECKLRIVARYRQIAWASRRPRRKLNTT